MEFIVKAFVSLVLLFAAFVVTLFLYSPLVFIGVHFVLSLVTSLIIFLLLPKRYSRRLVNFLGIFLSIFLLPVIGYLLYIPLFLIVLRFQREEEPLGLEKIPVEELTLEKVRVAPRRYGESVVRFLSQKPEALKEDALVLLEELGTPSAIEIAKKALLNGADEVRLAAFSIVSRLEGRLNERIARLKERFSVASSEVEKGKLAKEIAQSYWELLYYNLVDDELKKFVIEEALRWAQESVKRIKDPETFFLVGRLFLKYGKKEEAYPFLRKAYISGDPVTRKRAIPYLAEAEFEKGNVERVKELFSELPLSLHPDVVFMKNFWQGRKVV